MCSLTDLVHAYHARPHICMTEANGPGVVEELDLQGLLPLVASAAAAKVAGHRAAAGRLVRQGPARQRSHPTYYGGAWPALGQPCSRRELSAPADARPE